MGKAKETSNNTFNIFSQFFVNMAGTILLLTAGGLSISSNGSSSTW
jgi:hypothetical protein